ncbi:MAG: hypothetical protein H6567_13765 [Lewinellaceae bacterium]|nr:hypothetical protein [Lewinellaceae bacterium]
MSHGPSKRNRCVIYVKDIMIITGKSEKSARRYLKTILDKLGKSKEQFVTVDEFCDYAGLEKAEVEALLL